ncbi:hypothetical protein LTR04_002869, partial [Oleoguttula sp. CCFEE 6159]
MHFQSLSVAALSLLALTFASPVDKRLTLSAYAPFNAICPSTPLVRPATSLSSSEAAYIFARKPKAKQGLAAWLTKTNSGFKTSSLPTVGFTSSGGGLRALLETAGVIQSFDSRDSNVGTSGVFQGLTYESGLSGGGWFLSSFAGNNWPTVTSLKTGLWEQAFMDSVLLPSVLLTQDVVDYSLVADDIVSKQAAGYPVTIVDPYGRLLSYQLLYGFDGGVADRLSGITSNSNFTSHNVPYPIITALGVATYQGQCYPTQNATQYEFHPYEFGSWDAGVSAFTQTEYLGSHLTNGQPTVPGVCTVNYDNLGYVLGTSSDVFDAGCAIIPAVNNTASLPQTLEALVAQAHAPATQDTYAIYPNPFHGYARSTLVSSELELNLADGGESNQNNPIWPFIQPERNVDVLIVNDNSADTTDNFPDGTEIHTTYLRAQQVGLSKMPFIPDVPVFVSEGLNKRATFFGCNETGTTLMIFLPNVAYSYPSGQPTARLQYNTADTDGMIANGVLIGTQNGDANWPFCLACGIM